MLFGARPAKGEGTSLVDINEVAGRWNDTLQEAHHAQKLIVIVAKQDILHFAFCDLHMGQEVTAWG